MKTSPTSKCQSPRELVGFHFLQEDRIRRLTQLSLTDNSNCLRRITMRKTWKETPSFTLTSTSANKEAWKESWFTKETLPQAWQVSSARSTICRMKCKKSLSCCWSSRLQVFSLKLWKEAKTITKKKNYKMKNHITRTKTWSTNKFIKEVLKRTTQLTKAQTRWKMFRQAQAKKKWTKWVS